MFEKTSNIKEYCMVDELKFNIVLVEPEIPPNTGNIARLCAATGSVLHLVEPLGFSIDDRQLKRAGLDYWDSVEVRLWSSFEQFRNAFPHGRFFYLSTKPSKRYLDADFCPGDFLVFGKETKGLPEELLHANPDTAITIPMPAGAVRSLNLSTSAGIVLYEALRQTGRLG
ncbi:MAG: tRNA (cytidine(34)-2'-O)-methyltransferase [Pedobacter sp.]